MFNSTVPAPTDSWRRSSVLRVGGGAALSIGLVALVAKLALAPVQGVQSAAACERAYAAARTHADSQAVDFMSFPDPSRRPITRRCNEVRPLAVGAPGR